MHNPSYIKAILLFYAAQINDTYKEIKLLLCAEQTREYMFIFRHCPKCLEKHNLIIYLKSKLYDGNESIEFSQWIFTERM